jgi:Poly-beta-hydroxybutyrate polymerase (PhaC) N-terminus
VDGCATKRLDAFKVGKTLAVTPGKVVHRTRLAEIIQHVPATDHVRPEPVAIVPAWIMKYYILDLSPVNSLVRFLTQQGFTAFIVSCSVEDRDVSFDDYRTEGSSFGRSRLVALTVKINGCTRAWITRFDESGECGQQSKALCFSLHPLLMMSR